MTDSNLTRVALIKETTLGTLPSTPRMRIARITGEGLNYAPQFFTSQELRSDRMRPDPVKINEETGGDFSFEWSYPPPLSAASAIIESAMLSTWTETNSRDNDGTADSVITDIGTTANQLTCTTGTAFVIGQLVRTTGFTTAANNTVAKVTTGGATSYVASAGGYVAEAAPPATARAKVVGCEGVAADIVATATGLTCTTLSFTGVGITVGMWIKIGGTTAGQQFATAANNGWARVTAVSATAITLDNRPAGWSSDTGTGKTIRLFFGDRIINGTTLLGLSIEKGFLGQTTPTYVLQKGNAVDQLSLDATTGGAVTGSAALLGMTSSQGTSANGSTYAAAPTGLVFTSNVSVASITIGGTSVGSPAWARSFQMQLANNLRRITAVGNVGAVSIGKGALAVTGQVEVYFGNNTLFASLLAGTATDIVARFTASSQAFITELPRVTFTGGSPNAGGQDQDVTLPMTFEASIDTSVTNSMCVMHRLEYFE